MFLLTDTQLMLDGVLVEECPSYDDIQAMRRYWLLLSYCKDTDRRPFSYADASARQFYSQLSLWYAVGYPQSVPFTFDSV